MKVISRSEVIRLTLDGNDPFYYVVNTFHPRFYQVPVRVEAEFTLGEPDFRRAYQGIRITGQRYRVMADGRHLAVGPGRGPASEPTIWYFPGNYIPDGDLAKIARAAWLERTVLPEEAPE